MKCFHNVFFTTRWPCTPWVDSNPGISSRMTFLTILIFVKLGSCSFLIFSLNSTLKTLLFLSVKYRISSFHFSKFQYWWQLEMWRSCKKSLYLSLTLHSTYFQNVKLSSMNNEFAAKYQDFEINVTNIYNQAHVTVDAMSFKTFTLFWWLQNFAVS